MILSTGLNYTMTSGTKSMQGGADISSNLQVLQTLIQ